MTCQNNCKGNCKVPSTKDCKLNCRVGNVYVRYTFNSMSVGSGVRLITVKDNYTGKTYREYL